MNALAWVKFFSQTSTDRIIFSDIQRHCMSSISLQDFSVSHPGCQRLFSRGFQFLSASPPVALAYGRRCVGLQPTPKIPPQARKTSGTHGSSFGISL